MVRPAEKTKSMMWPRLWVGKERCCVKIGAVEGILWF